jgi:hypothetical protein
MHVPRPRFLYSLFLSILLSALASSAVAQVHGLWVWKGPSLLEQPGAAGSLRQFCLAQGINEIYISVAGIGSDPQDRNFASLISELHKSHIRVEALISSTEADEPGKHRDKLLEHVRSIIHFNQTHPHANFDGVHLDIEPQQRPENKGPGNLHFLPGLADAYRAACAVAEPAHLTVNADIQNKLLKGDLQQRRMLLTSVPRVTLMLYELSHPDDGETPQQQTEKLRDASQKFFQMAYDGLGSANAAKMSIALRTPDYQSLLPSMLQSLDAANANNPHYLGWARHSYNDTLH